MTKKIKCKYLCNHKELSLTCFNDQISMIKERFIRTNHVMLNGQYTIYYIKSKLSYIVSNVKNDDVAIHDS